LVDIIIVSNRKEEELDGFFSSIVENTPESNRIIITCQPYSSSINRNMGLFAANTDIIAMLDDDIIGFYSGWLTDLIHPLLKDENVILSSARLTIDGEKPARMMGGKVVSKCDIQDVDKSVFRGYKRVATACFAMRKNELIFDENFIGSGYEDTDFCNRLNMSYPGKRIVISNKCKLIHLNRMTNQGGNFFESNKSYYLSLYPDDKEVINQKDWTKND